MAIVALAGVGKLLDLPGFLHEMQRWRTISGWLAATLVVLIPAVEVSLPTLWILGFNRRMLAVLVLLVLTVYTGAYVNEWMSGAPPKCACLGVWIGSSFLDRPLAVLVRNGILIGLLGLGIVIESRLPKIPTRRNTPGARAALPAERGFTITEVLVVILILAVLLAIAIPQLMSARTKAVDARELVYLRNHSQVFAMYSNDYQEAFPFLTRLDGQPTTLTCELMNFSGEVRHFDVWQWWHVGLGDRYYQGKIDDATFGWRHLPGVRSIRTAIIYPIVFITNWKYWSYTERTSLPAQIGGTRAADVTYPTKKILLAEWIAEPSASASEQTNPFSYVDGHADAAILRNLTPRGPYERAYPVYSSYPSLRQFSYFYTENGVRGRDFR